MRKYWQEALAILFRKAKHLTTKPQAPPIRPGKYLKWEEVVLPNGVRAEVVKDFKPVVIVWERSSVRKTEEDKEKNKKRMRRFSQRI